MQFRKVFGLLRSALQDKDYAAEAEYVARTIRRPSRRTRFLNLAPAPAAMAACLLHMGFDVHGIERSRRWWRWQIRRLHRRLSRGADPSPARSAIFARSSSAARFDAVIALFHVMSYQTSNKALAGGFSGGRASSRCQVECSCSTSGTGRPCSSQRPLERTKEGRR